MITPGSACSIPHRQAYRRHFGGPNTLAVAELFSLPHRRFLVTKSDVVLVPGTQNTVAACPRRVQSRILLSWAAPHRLGLHSFFGVLCWRGRRMPSRSTQHSPSEGSGKWDHFYLGYSECSHEDAKTQLSLVLVCAGICVLNTCSNPT